MIRNDKAKAKRRSKPSPTRKGSQITCGRFAGRRLDSLGTFELVRFRNEVLRGEHHRIWRLLVKNECEQRSTPSGAALDKELKEFFTKLRLYSDDRELYDELYG